MTDWVRVVLCMNVRNEAHIIERCLEAAMPLVDGWVISDTGSTDATLKAIAEVAERHGKPGRIARHRWRNFGHNRTLSVREARAWVSEQGWPHERTYLMFLDADMVLQASPDFDKQQLSATHYQLVQHSGDTAYSNTRLACLALDWQAVGATHEYWQAQGEGPALKLETLHILDLGDGGSKGNKLGRDYRLLKQELLRDPGNARHTFYLAQTCFDAGRYAEAVRWYARRWALGGWDEERWFARYRQGLALLGLGDAERAAGTLLEAFDERPTRAEPLWALARSQRERGRHHSALMLAERALKIPFPSQDSLFVEKAVYEWQLWEEVMICAWYCGRREIGSAASEQLLLRRGHDDHFYDYVASNETFYHEAFPQLRSGTLIPSKADSDQRFEAPTIARLGTRVLVSAVVRERNVSIEWDRASGFTQFWREGTANAPLYRDLCWTVHEDRVWFAANCHQLSDDAGAPRAVLGRMNEACDAIEHSVALERDGKPLSAGELLPWWCLDELFLVSAFEPFTMLRVDVGSGATGVASVREAPFRATRFCGCAAPLPIPGRKGRFLVLTREAAQQRGKTVHAHRFVELDADEGLKAVSRPFFFERLDFERASGLCDLGDGKLLVTYERDERDARWVELAWSAVLDAL